MLRAATPLTLRENDLEALRGINDRIDLDEVADVYLPLTRLLNLYVAAAQNLHKVSATFLGTIAPKVPYVIGVAGSVAVGKSTFARILQTLLSRWPDHPKVDLVTTDGFLYPNEVLEDRGIMNRKGFPESYDTRRAAAVPARREVRATPRCAAPVYSHVVYDIVDDQELRRPPARHPDPRGPQRAAGRRRRQRVRERLLRLLDLHRRRGARHRGVVRGALPQAPRDGLPGPRSRTSATSPTSATSEAVATARVIWRDINGKNLQENILPTRERAALVLHKAEDHRVTSVQLRKL